uniref:Uncharacterized protein n=1 Tax=Oryza glumipatula TaxID=40148 RepID=A0A0D9Z2D4_9ORYZ
MAEADDAWIEILLRLLGTTLGFIQLLQPSIISNLASHFIFKSFILAAAIQTQDFWSVVHAITGEVCYNSTIHVGSDWFSPLSWSVALAAAVVSEVAWTA